MIVIVTTILILIFLMSSLSGASVTFIEGPPLRPTEDVICECVEDGWICHK